MMAGLHSQYKTTYKQMTNMSDVMVEEECIKY